MRGPNVVLGEQACACPTGRSPWGRLSLPLPRGTPKTAGSQQLTRLCFCNALERCRKL